MNDYIRFAYGVHVIPSHKKIKLTLWQRINRAIKKRSIKELRVKEIEISNCKPISLMNVKA